MLAVLQETNASYQSPLSTYCKTVSKESVTRTVWQSRERWYTPAGTISRLLIFTALRAKFRPGRRENVYFSAPYTVPYYVVRT